MVGAAIQGIPNLWCFMEDLGFWGPPLALSPKVTPTQITSAAGLLIQDWTKPIREILRFPGANIHITNNLKVPFPVQGLPEGAVGLFQLLDSKGEV